MVRLIPMSDDPSKFELLIRSEASSVRGTVGIHEKTAGSVFMTVACLSPPVFPLLF